MFTSHVWRELFRLSGTQLQMSSAFRPQTHRQSEVTNRIITVYLHCLVSNRPRRWLHWLPWAEYCYSTSYETALRSTPFQVIYGRPPPAMVLFQARSSRVAAVDQQLRDRDTFLTEIRDRLFQAQALMKSAHDKLHRPLEFAVADLVWLRLNQRAAATVRDGVQSKLAPKYYGPYEVLGRVGSLAYRLLLPPRARIHNAFHVAFLKKFEGVQPGIVPPLSPILRGRVVPQPEQVIRAKPTTNSWELLVRWKDHSSGEATWEPLEQFKEAYRDFQLEDELFHQAGGSVMDTFFGKQYSRRKKNGPEVGYAVSRRGLTSNAVC
jgi:hypothetical protein